MCIDNQSSCNFKKDTDGTLKINKGLKILKKYFISEGFLGVYSSHDGYLKKYGIIHERKIDYYPKLNKFLGEDKLIKKNFKSTNFEIRFYFEPGTKITKTR